MEHFSAISKPLASPQLRNIYGRRLSGSVTLVYI